MAGEKSDRDIILEILTVLAESVKADIPKATGETAEAITVETDETSGRILAPRYIGALEDGRRPTRQGAGSSGGGATLRERILIWIQAKGIQGRAKNGKFITQESLSWAIASSIHKKGTLLYRLGGHSGVLSKTFENSRIRSLMNSFIFKYQAVIRSDVLEGYKTK